MLLRLQRTGVHVCVCICMCVCLGEGVSQAGNLTGPSPSRAPKSLTGGGFLELCSPKSLAVAGFWEVCVWNFLSPQHPTLLLHVQKRLLVAPQVPPTCLSWKNKHLFLRGVCVSGSFSFCKANANLSLGHRSEFPAPLSGRADLAGGQGTEAFPPSLSNVHTLFPLGDPPPPL